MTTSHSARLWSVLPALGRAARWLYVLATAAAVALYSAYTWHWPLIQDSAVMHYVVFLMQHGLQPYREITDNNLPGAYLLERGAMLVFGSGDLGWRLYDFSLLAAMTAAFMVIAWPVDWLAGFFAGTLFALQHGVDGMWFTAEREQEMAVLLAVACALLFLSVRQHKPVLVGGFGFLAAMAASVKPTLAPLVLLLFPVLFQALRRRQRKVWPYLSWGAAGLLLASALNLGFLLNYHALTSFLFVLRTVTPVYAGLSDPGRRSLLLQAVPWVLLPLFGMAAFALAVQWRRWDWERVVLALVVAVGVLSYVIQAKGFPYHRYLFLSFGLLLVGMELLPARESKGISALGLLALLYTVFVILPFQSHQIRLHPGLDEMAPAMEADLKQLGGNTLQGQVQCFDMILGCLKSLQRLGLVENTGFTGDMLLFARHPNPATAYYQNLYQRLQQAHPARVLLVTNQDFGQPNSFDRLALWPAFNADLRRNYRLVITRTFPRQGKLLNEPDASPESALAYRIYVRRQQPLPPPNQQTPDRPAPEQQSREN